jgi:hypothetical protein
MLLSHQDYGRSHLDWDINPVDTNVSVGGLWAVLHKLPQGLCAKLNFFFQRRETLQSIFESNGTAMEELRRVIETLSAQRTTLVNVQVVGSTLSARANSL